MSHLAKARFLCLFLLSLSFLFLNLSLQNRVQAIKNFVLYLASPSSVLATKIFINSQNLGKNFLGQLYLNEENRRLRLKLEEYAHLETAARETLEENKRLREILHLQERKDFKFIPAQAIGQDTQIWCRSLIINKGSSVGVRKDLPVIAVEESKECLVGRVVEVSPDSSKILLLTDPLSALAGFCPQSKADGIAEGRGKDLLFFKYVLPEANIAEGDLVVTAGTGGVFPPGLPVGKIVKVTEERNSPYKEATIRPLINFSHLRELIVLQLEK